MSAVQGIVTGSSRPSGSWTSGPSFLEQRTFVDPVRRSGFSRPYAAGHPDHLVCAQQDRLGIVMPSAFAVFRFTTSSNLVGCSIGRSPGLAPFRILSTYPAARRIWSACWPRTTSVRLRRRSTSPPRCPVAETSSIAWPASLDRRRRADRRLCTEPGHLLARQPRRPHRTPRRLHLHEHQFDRHRGCHCLEILDHLLRRGRVRIPQDCDPVESWIASLSICSRLALSSIPMNESPVILPPGRARFVTRPAATGSNKATTMGMGDVARRSACAASAFVTTITSTLSCTSSSARPGRRTAWSCAVRNSNRMLRPSAHPNSRSPCRKLSTNGSAAPAVSVSTPTTGILSVC